MTRIRLVIFAAIALVLAASTAWSQNDSTPKKRLHSPAAVRGIIGGEAHNSYVIKAKRGNRMTVEISWRKEADNRAEFTVSESKDFSSGEQAAFGKPSDRGRKWSGRVPRTQDYYIYVVGHPTAHYRLIVRVK